MASDRPPPGRLTERPLASRWWQRIATRLLALVLAVSVLPTLALGLLAIRSGRANVEREVLLRNQEVASWGAGKVESYLANVEENLRLLDSTASLDPANPPRAEPPLRLFLSFMEDVKEVFLLDAQGRERVRLSEGTLYTPDDLGSRRGHPEFEIPARGRRFIGPVTTSTFSEPFVTVAIPLKDLAEDRLVGVIGAEVNLKRLWDEVLSSKVGQAGYLYLVNDRGVVIAHPDFSLVLAQTDVRQVPVVQRFLAGEDPRPGGVVTAEYGNYQGRPVLGTFARSAGLGWAVVVEQPVAEALANVEQTKVETIFMLLNTLLVTALLGLVAARRLTGPLHELRRGATLVGRGELSHAIPADGRDEIGDVARAFNRMTANLRRSFTSLRTVLDTSTRISASLRLEEILPAAAAETGRVIPGVECWLLLLETPSNGGGAGRGHMYRGSDSPPTPVELTPGSYPALVRSLGGQEVVQAPAAEVPGGEEGAGSALVVPLGAGQRCVGAMLLISREAAREFDDEETALCRTIANQVGIAVENARLYARLEDSYRELQEAQDRLLRTEKLRALGEMASGVAHNFNNILGSILGRAELLQATADLPKLRAGLGMIEQAAMDGASMVRRLKDFTRMGNGVPEEAIDMRQAVADVLELTRARWKDGPEAQGLPIRIETAFEQVPPVLGSASELREVLTNLLLNAVEAMPRGGRLRLATARQGGWVVTTVEDSGAGMPEEVRRRIFEPFFTTKGPRGTGLGMSVSYGIIQRHQGEIAVASVPGRGTTVTVRLPAARGPVPAPAPRVELTASLTGARLLVIDDDPSMSSLLAEILRTAGYTVVTANGGREGIDLFRRQAMDLVLTDLGMEVSGWEVAQGVKALAPDMPIGLVTGHAVDLDSTQLKDAGIDFMVDKPFKVGEVLRAVANALSRQVTPEAVVALA